MYTAINSAIERLAKSLALLGGCVLLMLIVLSCISITGRSLSPLGLGPVPGDFELIEMGIAFSIFCFLPWCQFSREHARVDLLKHRMSDKLNRSINTISEVLMLLLSLLITWRLWAGMLDKKSYTETTFILQIPLWYAYAAAMIGAVGFVLTCLFCVYRSTCGLRSTTH